jgi:hypothetical protein
LSAECRVARLSLVQFTKTGSNAPFNKLYQTDKACTKKLQNIPNRLEIYPNFQFHGLPKYNKIVFLVLKYFNWQPWQSIGSC